MNILDKYESTNFYTNWLNPSKGAFRTQLNIYGGASFQNS